MKDINWAVLGTGVIANEMAVALKKNGKNIYAVGNRTYEKAVAFGEKYGINVQVVSAGTGECLERISAEKDNPQADLMYGGMTYANSYNPDYVPLFEEYVAAGDDKLPEAYQNFNGITTHYCLDGSAALLINVEEYEKLGLKIDEFKGYEERGRIFKQYVNEK